MAIAKATSDREVALLRAARNLFMSNRVSPEKIEKLRQAINAYPDSVPDCTCAPEASVHDYRCPRAVYLLSVPPAVAGACEADGCHAAREAGWVFCPEHRASHVEANVSGPPMDPDLVLYRGAWNKALDEVILSVESLRK